MTREDICLRHLSDAEDWESDRDGIPLTSQGLIVLTLITSPSSV